VLGGDLTVARLGYGTMQLTGRGVWGEPADRATAKAIVRRAVELGVRFIDTADVYAPTTVQVDSLQSLLDALNQPVVYDLRAWAAGWIGEAAQALRTSIDAWDEARG
jgi:aryl-alcohol dehydrogenase-like predicted oxidoreductase